MAGKRTREELHELEFDEAPVRMGTVTALLRQCVTSADVLQKIYLYRDKNRRIYRPRIQMTEELIGRDIIADVPEEIVAFDVHLGKVTAKFPVKSDRPEIGEKIVLISRNQSSRDAETEKEVEVQVTDVVWGSFIKEVEDGVTKEYALPTIGYIEVKVIGTYSRSICLPPAYKKKRNLFPTAL